MERFKDSWNAAVASAGSVACLVPEIMKSSEKHKNLNKDERIEAAKAMYFFIHANRMRYGSRINQVNDGVVLGTDNYCMNLDKAYAILLRLRSNRNASDLGKLEQVLLVLLIQHKTRLITKMIGLLQKEKKL